jgi:hypothetical protein
VVPHDVKHGSNLYCSFPACRNEGIKFCYCSHCGIPVAKRNFRQRHDHASSKKKGDTSNEGQGSGSLRPSRITPQVPVSSAERKEPGSHQSESAKSPGNGGNEAGNSNQLAPKRSLSFKKNGKNVSSESEEIIQSKKSQDRQLRWASLLRQRPRDISGDEMSAWLISVLEVSNVKNPGGGSTTRKETLSREGDNLSATETPSSGSGSSVRSSEPSEESTFGSSEGASSDCSEGGSSSDSENGSNNELGDRKRPPVKEESTEKHRAPMKKRKQNMAA